MRTLVLCDDLWHPGEMVRRGLACLEAGEFDFEFLTDGASWSTPRLAGFSLVLLAKSNVISAGNRNPWLTPAAQQELQHYLHRGHGLVVVHGGTAGYGELPVMRALTGGAFLRHPDPCPVAIIPQAGHPVVAGVKPFSVPDEHYFMALDDRQAEVFLQSESVHGLQPAGWTRREGAGRVCVLTPGHTLEIWLHPGFQSLLRNSLHWASGNN